MTKIDRILQRLDKASKQAAKRQTHQQQYLWVRLWASAFSREWWRCIHS